MCKDKDGRLPNLRALDKRDKMPNLKAKEYKKFEDIKYVREDGSKYWSARELADVLDYSQ